MLRNPVGVSEVAEILGWPGSKVSEYRRRGVLPAPDDVLTSGPVWERAKIEWWAAAQKGEESIWELFGQQTWPYAWNWPNIKKALREAVKVYGAAIQDLRTSDAISDHDVKLMVAGTLFQAEHLFDRDDNGIIWSQPKRLDACFAFFDFLSALFAIKYKGHMPDMKKDLPVIGKLMEMHIFKRAGQDAFPDGRPLPAPR